MTEAEPWTDRQETFRPRVSSYPQNHPLEKKSHKAVTAARLTRAARGIQRPVQPGPGQTATPERDPLAVIEGLTVLGGFSGSRAPRLTEGPLELC